MSVPISERWLTMAREDEAVAEMIWQSGSELWRALCYHAQQYVEKVLKGVIEGAGKKPPRVHDLGILIRECEELVQDFPLVEDEILFLSSVYIDSRYPPDVGLLPGGEPSKRDAKTAIRAVRKVSDWVSKRTEPVVP